MRLVVGEYVQASLWMTGEESKEVREQYEADLVTAITDLCMEHGVVSGPVKLAEARPDEDLVPEVPDHIQGQRVRLLVAEAEVRGYVVQTSVDSFIVNLDRKDLMRLRRITRHEYQRRYPMGVLTDAQCDEIIEEIGPDAAVEALRRAHKAGH